MTLVYILISTFLISALSLVIFLLLAHHKFFTEHLVLSLVGLSTGTLLGGAFFHLMPESIELVGVDTTSLIMIGAFIVFFLVEKFLHWHHCHDNECPDHKHTLGYMNLFGDAIHNFIDGILIASAFSIDLKLGIITSLAIALHEIPQEIGDFSVLIYSGFSKQKAIFLNFMIGLTAVLGGVFGYLLIERVESFLYLFVAVAAGGFIYTSVSDLLPEIRREIRTSRWLSSFGLFLLGLVFMYGLKGVV